MTVIPLDMPRGLVYQVLVSGSCVVVVCKAGDGKVVGGSGSSGAVGVTAAAAAAAEHVIATYDIFSRRLLWARCLPNSVALNGSCVAVGRHSLLLPLCADKFIEQKAPSSGEDGDVAYVREPLNIAVELTVGKRGKKKSEQPERDVHIQPNLVCVCVFFSKCQLCNSVRLVFIANSDGSVARAWQLPRTFSLVEAVVPMESRGGRDENGMTAQYIVILEGRDIAVLWDNSKVSDSDELAQLDRAAAQV